jgi:PAS domain S-box-containing protein
MKSRLMQRTLWAIIGVSSCVYVFFVVAGQTFLAGSRWAHLPVHAGVEMMGALVALLVAKVLLGLERKGAGTSFNVQIAGALVGMGVLDGLHAATTAGNLFVWLHSIATFVGGLLFAAICLPAFGIKKAPRLLWVLAATLALGLTSTLFPDVLPAMTSGGSFTPLAEALNITGGVLLFVAAARLMLAYRRGRNADDLLFCLHCSLFGAAAIMFEQSKLWDPAWWGWHLLRLMAYGVALWFVFRVDRLGREALEENEAKLRSVLETTAHWIWEVDRDGVCIFSNDTVRDLLGCSPVDIVGRPFFGEIPGHVGCADAAELHELMAPQKGWKDHVLRWRHRDGTVRYLESSADPILDAAGTVVGFRGAARDVTDHVVARAALAASEEKYRTLLENLPQRVFYKDRNSVYVSCNENYARDLGIEARDIAGTTDFDFHPPEFAEKYRRDDLQIMNSGDTVEMEEGYVQDGQTKTVRTVKTPLRDENGEVIGILGIFFDITERQQAQEEKARLEAALRQAQKMEAVGQLAGGIAHDFNNILTVILGNLSFVREELSERDSPSDASLLEGIEEIESHAQRAARLTHQLLTYSRRQVAQVRELDLNAVLVGLEMMLRRLLTEDILLEVLPNAASSWICADEGLIEQVIMNLVLNARDAMPKGGRLTIETANVVLDESDLSAHPDAVAGPHVVLAISDTGEGMSDETMERIFEPFFTTKPTGAGTGLGLATAYGIVRQAGGHITVSSELGGGTRFEVRLPAIEALSQTGDEYSEDRQVPEPAKDELLLVCEDDAAVRKLTARLLRSGGYEVLTAANAEEAREHVRTHGSAIDLLLTDVIMPGMNGKELSDELTGLVPGLKTLFVSGYTSEIIAHHGVLDEEVTFLHKPFCRHALLCKVREMLDRRGAE